MVVLINTKFTSKVKLKFYIVALTVAFITAAAACVGYNVFSDSYIAGAVKERSEICFENVLNKISMQSFEAQNEDPHFSEEKHDIQDIRAVCGASALYTVSYSQSGKPVYVLASFADGSVREDYRKGEEVDAQILPYVSSALAGKSVTKNLENLFGRKTYICVYPAVDEENGSIAGAVGVEYDVSGISEKMSVPALFYFVIMAAAVFVIIFGMIASFNKFSSQIADVISNTDILTGFGNRTAYNSRIAALDKKISDNIGSEFKIFVVLFSINDLSVVNDTFGSESGDNYIKEVAGAVYAAFGRIGDVYRIGGDEFAVVSEDHTEDELEECLDAYSDKEKEKNTDNSGYAFSVSYGYSGFVSGGDADMRNTVKRANEKMRRKKQENKQKSMRVPR